MFRVRSLKSWSGTGYSMYTGQTGELPDSLATELVRCGYVELLPEPVTVTATPVVEHTPAVATAAPEMSEPTVSAPEAPEAPREDAPVKHRTAKARAPKPRR